MTLLAPKRSTWAADGSRRSLLEDVRSTEALGDMHSPQATGTVSATRN
jgi:hypothetical protein